MKLSLAEIYRLSPCLQYNIILLFDIRFLIISGICTDFYYWWTMNRLVQICIGIIGVPFLIVIWAYFTKDQMQILTPTESWICVVPIQAVRITRNDESFETPVVWTGMEWVAFFDPLKKQWITAFHVIQYCNQWETPSIDDRTHLVKKCFINWKPIANIQRVWISDLSFFDIDQWFCDNGQLLDSSTWVRLLSYLSGQLIELPVKVAGTMIDYVPNYGQSGSPIFSGNLLIGIISRKTENAGYIELVNH